MKIIYKTYRFALLPTKEEEVLLNKHFGFVRYVYNHFLSERMNQYQESKKSDNYYKQSAALTCLKKQEETIWLKEVNSQALQGALRHLETAYKISSGVMQNFPGSRASEKRTVLPYRSILKWWIESYISQSSERALR